MRKNNNKMQKLQFLVHKTLDESMTQKNASPLYDYIIYMIV